ncbi:Syntaxin-related protein KNOLLE [Glycine soja]
MNDLMTKSFTSYVELKKVAMKEDVDLEAGGPGDRKVELSSSTTHLDTDMGLFLEEAEKVKAEMGSLRDILGRLQQANEESKSLHKPEAHKALRSRINAEILAVLKKARAIRTQLEEMDRANAANRRLSALKDGTPAIYRTRIAVTNGLRKKLKELMMDFQDLRQRMMTEYKDTVCRRYFTVTGEHPDEDVIEKIIANGNEEEVLAKAIEEHGRGKVLDTVLEIQDRHDAAKEVEKSLLELHQVFLDMAVMVEAQGEKMDDIEHHVFHASHYVKDGTKSLQSAKEYQKRSRKWMCIGIILLLILILIKVLRLQLELAKELNKPASVHFVSAFGVLLELMKSLGPFPPGVILHSCLGSAEMVPEFSKLSAYFSFSGTIYVKTVTPDALPMSDIDSLHFVEGDTSLIEELLAQTTTSSTSGSSLGNSSHFLADDSMLPKETLNHPTNIHNVLDYVASMLLITKEDLAELSYQNAVRLLSYEGSKVLQK